ncbi:Eukaryotic translation initiation factor 4E transporter [Lemmus lemmus]
MGTEAKRVAVLKSHRSGNRISAPHLWSSCRGHGSCLTGALAEIMQVSVQGIPQLSAQGAKQSSPVNSLKKQTESDQPSLVHRTADPILWRKTVKTSPVGRQRIGNGRVFSAQAFEKNQHLSDEDLLDLRGRDTESDYKDKRSRKKFGDSIRVFGTTGETPSQLSIFTEQEQGMKEVEDLTIQLQSIKYEQIELCGFMTNYYYKDLNNR